MRVHCYHLDTAFLYARLFVEDVMDVGALFRAGAWDSAWDDLFDCWCGCPL